MQPATPDKTTPSGPPVEPTIALMLTMLDTEVEVSEQCELIAVTNRGCLIRSPRLLQKDTAVRLESITTGHSITGRIVFCAPFEDQQEFWRIGIAVEQGNVATILAENQKDQPHAAVSAQAAATKPTAAVATAVMGKGASLSPAHPKGSSEALNRSSGKPQASAERLSADEILKAFEQRIRQKLDKFSSGFEARFQQQAIELLNRSRAELESRVSTHLEQLRTQVEASTTAAAKLHEQSEGRLHRWRADLQDLEAKWEEFRRFSSDLEKQTAKIQRDVAEADRQITARMQECSTFAQERLTETTEQIRSHVRAGVEMAQKHIESSGAEVLARIQETAKKSEELMRRADEAGERLGKLAQTAESTLEKAILKLTAEKLEHLKKDIDDRIHRSAAQLESTLAKAMESFCGTQRGQE